MISSSSNHSAAAAMTSKNCSTEKCETEVAPASTAPERELGASNDDNVYRRKFKPIPPPPAAIRCRRPPIPAVGQKRSVSANMQPSEVGRSGEDLRKGVCGMTLGGDCEVDEPGKVGDTTFVVSGRGANKRPVSATSANKTYDIVPGMGRG